MEFLTPDVLYIAIPVIAAILGFSVYVAKKDSKKPSQLEAPKEKIQVTAPEKAAVKDEFANIIADVQKEIAKGDEDLVSIKKVEQPKKSEGISFSERLKNGLSRSRSEVWGKVTGLFSGNKIDDETLESLEEVLYAADIGPQTVSELMEAVRVKAKEGNFTAEEFKKFLFDFLKAKIEPIQTKVDPGLYQFNPADQGKTKVIMVVGVNGAGKTTTIGKLATKLRAQGASVVVGACDTFRAAAVDQLQVWCDRAGATMIRAKEGANPSGVGYDALQMALNQKADYCILDTAGRLHTKENLMDELTKSRNVLRKLDESAPHQVLLVIDAITGQNAIRQAQEFNKALELTGLIFTKCDGSSKAGSAISIVKELNVPIAYIGVGESAEDLDVFNVDEYLSALLG